MSDFDLWQPEKQLFIFYDTLDCTSIEQNCIYFSIIPTLAYQVSKWAMRKLVLCIKVHFTFSIKSASGVQVTVTLTGRIMHSVKQNGLESNVVNTNDKTNIFRQLTSICTPAADSFLQ